LEVLFYKQDRIISWPYIKFSDFVYGNFCTAKPLTPPSRQTPKKSKALIPIPNTGPHFIYLSQKFLSAIWMDSNEWMEE
jgi:hypothetical protein